MSLDSQPKSTKCPLTLKIPLNREISSSRSSSLEFSSNFPTTSSSSSIPTLNVKFAPLPQLLPRKRRSTVPLGMAARGQLIPRRTGYKMQKVPPVWTDDGPDEFRLQQEELAAHDARCNAYHAYVAARKEEDEDEPESMYGWQCRTKNNEQVDEDPLQALGRIVKVAGKTLWKQVSNIDMAAAAAATSMPKPRVDSKGQEDSKTRSRTSIESCPPPTLRPILESITSNLTSNVDDYHAEEEGLVWEEEIGSSFPFDISQTETIIEGRSVHPRTTSKVEVVSRYPPPSPNVSNLKRVLTKPPHSSKKFSPPFKVKRGS